ncbi:MAG: hypothetical protein KC545_11735, partial [Nitrospira sp.]|nr:hypothetical protein [Nitrospira sp.]
VTHRNSSLLSLILLVVFLGLTSWLPFQATRHTDSHAHHQATTHASPLCSWLCAAGLFSHSEAPPISRSFDSFISLPPLPSPRWNESFSTAPLSRGPPAFFPFHSPTLHL